MSKTWTCEWCGKTEETRLGHPPEWITYAKPGEILLCSITCLYAAAEEMRTGKDN